MDKKTLTHDPRLMSTANWPEQRGTPSYRPIDTNLDFTRRPWANTIPETIFTVTMIGLGVQAIGLANTIFR
ncbi:Aldehyde dehydrogenase [Pseudozyma hubeiensis]|nr:Aldehyde dehydrogenase [Pseudozyma hubeiensis]